MNEYFEVKRNPELIERKELEQIRAEIDREMSTKPSEFNQHDESDYDRGLFKALLIIDKYTKGESE